jgi:large subunit ribosomal protein L14
MILKGTQLRLYDNSGAKKVKAILVPHNVGKPGSILVVTIKFAIAKKFRSKKKNLKKGEIHKVLLVSTSKGVKRLTGTYLNGPANACIMLRKENISLPYANRIKRPLFREIRKSTKIAALAPNLF